MRDSERRRRRTTLGAALVLVAAVSVPWATGTTAARAVTGVGTVTIGGKCLDDAGGGTADGTVVQVLSCNGAAQQNWTWNGDGTVTVAGKCLDVTNASNATGALLELWSCNGGANQKFSWQPDSTVLGAKSDKCLAVQGGSITDNARVGLAVCDPAQAVQQWNATTAPQPQYTLTAGTTGTFGHPDDTPASAFLDANGRFHYQSAHSLYGATQGRSWSFYTGSDFDTATADAALDSSGTNADTTAFCNNSPTGVNATDAPAGSGYAERNYCDLVGVWVDPDTGTWYGLVHNEFTPQPFGDGVHYDAIDYASSTDHGATWTIQGHAITSPYSTTRGDTTAFPNQTYYYGDGDPRLFVDYRSGYFYVSYLSRAVDQGGGWGGFEEHVARAPIAQKMATGSWTKWSGGTWSTAGVGGAESDIVPANGVGSGYLAPGDGYSPARTGSIANQIAAGTMPPSSQLSVLNIAWDAYLGKYIGTPENEAGNAPLPFYATDDLATQKWTYLGSVGAAEGSWYRWLLDSANLTSSTVVGRTFRSYCAFSCSDGSSGNYTTVSIAPNSPANLPAAPVSTSASYQIATSAGLNLARSGTGLTTAASNPADPAQQWNFRPTGDGFYTVTDAATGQALGVDAASDSGRAWDAPVTAGTLGATPTLGQQWSLQTVVQSPSTGGSSTATGAYRLVNRYSDLALSLTSGPQAVATAPQRGWDNNGASGDTRPSAAQQLTLTAVAGGSLSGPHTLTLSGQALDDPNWSTSPGTQLDTWATNGGQNQSWTLTRQPDGAYTVANAYSHLCADDNGNNTAVGTAVIQWTCDGAPNQEWDVTRLSSGVYTLTNVHTGLLMTAASAAGGALVTQQQDTGSSLQRWAVG